MSEKRKGIGGHTKPNNGATVSWLTPPWILERLGPFDLDPCPCLPQPFPTAARVIKGDGLVEPWPREESVWLNPPYGSALGKWLRKLYFHGNGIAICFARTETRTFFKWVWGKVSGLLFIETRPHFYRPDGMKAKGNSGGPCVLLAYGEQMAQRLRICNVPGVFVGAHMIQRTRSPSLPMCVLCREPIVGRVYYQAGLPDYPAHKDCTLSLD